MPGWRVVRSPQPWRLSSRKPRFPECPKLAPRSTRRSIRIGGRSRSCLWCQSGGCTWPWSPQGRWPGPLGPESVPQRPPTLPLRTRWCRRNRLGPIQKLVWNWSLTQRSQQPGSREKTMLISKNKEYCSAEWLYCAYNQCYFFGFWTLTEIGSK